MYAPLQRERAWKRGRVRNCSFAAVSFAVDFDLRRPDVRFCIGAVSVTGGPVPNSCLCNDNRCTVGVVLALHRKIGICWSNRAQRGASFHHHHSLQLLLETPRGHSYDFRIFAPSLLPLVVLYPRRIEGVYSATKSGTIVSKVHDTWRRTKPCSVRKPSLVLTVLSSSLNIGQQRSSINHDRRLTLPPAAAQWTGSCKARMVRRRRRRGILNWYDSANARRKSKRRDDCGRGSRR